MRLAPVVEVDHRICGHMNEHARCTARCRLFARESEECLRIQDIGTFNAVREAG